jgi:lactoylglutathione lyase
MILDHIAIWTRNLEILKDYYVKFFDGVANSKYVNTETNFGSYFITFSSGTRLEIMQRPGIPANLNDTVIKQHEGIIHLAFGMKSMEQVISKSEELQKAGFKILRGPRTTGDGYFEFETLDPDNNRIEVTTVIPEKHEEDRRYHI